MKKSYQLLCLLLTVLAFSTKSFAQNNLAPGDIAFVSYQSDPDPTNTFNPALLEFDDRFSMVVLKPGGLAAGTVIYFTSRGWDGPNNTWLDEAYPPFTFGIGSEAVVKWTVPAAGIPQGKEVFFINKLHDELAPGSEYFEWFAYSDEAGTIPLGAITNESPIVPTALPQPNGFTDGMSLYFSGGNILVFQTGPPAGPATNYNDATRRFITAILANIRPADVGTPTSYAAWDVAPNVQNESSIPPGLVNGQTCFLMSPGPLPHPAGLPPASVEPDNGKFSNCALSLAGTCTALQMSTLIYTIGNWTISFPVNNAFPAGQSSSQCTYPVTGNNTITLSSAPATTTQTVNLGTAITNITYNTTGATGATFSGLPPGVSGNWAANVVTISGTPNTLVGSPFSYTVTLTGGCGAPVTANGTITVTCPAITVAIPALATATQLLPYSRTFNATGGTAPYTYTTTSSLPAGLSFNASGLLYGTPTVTGSFPITVTATDANGCTGVSAAYNLAISAGTIGVARWVNNTAGTRPAQVVVNCIVYNTAPTTYTDIQTAVSAAGNGDVVYITDGTYAPSIVGGCPTAYNNGNYIFISNKTNLIITSATGSYCNSAAIVRNRGFSIASGNNITIQGLDMENVPVNAFYNTNAGFQTGNVTIKNNYVLNTWQHGIKTDDNPSDGVINRSIWEISGNRFENIGAFNPGGCSLGPVTAVWLAQAGFNCNIINNTITNTRWAGILCVGQGRNNAVASTEIATISGNRINQTVDAGIQIGFSAGAFYYSNGATITHNRITNANTSNKVGIGGITILQNNIYGVNINYNDVSASFNGLAIEIAGWENSLDTKTITNNNFYNLTPGSFGVTHIAGIAPNGLFGTGDDLNLYNLRNNYWGTANGPTYITNPGGTGSGLKKDVNVLGGGTYSLNDYVYMPFRTTAATVNSVVGCSSLPPAINTIALSSAVGTNAQTVCINSPITNITYATTGATGATVTGLPAGVTGSWAANVVTISGTPTVSGAALTYTVTLTGGCGALTATGTITVTPATNTITLSSAAGTNAQTVCINTAITPITYNTTGATGASVTGLPAGVTGSWAANMVTISGTPTVAGAALTYTVTLTGGCGAFTATGTIAVTANNTITLSSAAGTNAQTVCVNTPITPITYNTTGATGATVTGLPAGVSGSWAGNVVTISGTPTASGAALTYTITLTGGCGTITATGTITVNPNNTVTLSSAAGTDAQTVVVLNPITPITYATTGATGATFAGLPAGVTGSWAANVATISGTPTVTGSFNYTVTLTGGCGTATATGNINVIACLTNTWTGASNNNWFTPGNWSCGIVPTAPMNVVIPSGTPNPCVVAAGPTAQLRNFTINAGAIFTNNGTVNINGGGVVSNCGTYQGIGTFTGALFSNTCATAFVRPGSSPGCTIFGAGYTNGSGTEVIEIGGLTPCALHDQLQVTGTATLSGTLDVQLFGGFTPSCGQSYKIMTSTTLVGTFATINYPALPAGLAWGIQYNLPNPGDVTLRILDVQPPVITCPANIPVNNDPGLCSAVVNYAAPVVTDNCSLSNLTDFSNPWTNSGQRGVYFDIQNLSAGPVIINGLNPAMWAAAPLSDVFSVYFTTTANTWNGNQSNAGAWTLNTNANVNFPGGLNPVQVPVNLTSPITLAPGQSKGVFVVGTTGFGGGPNAYLSSIAGYAGPQTYSDGNLSFTGGIGTSGLFGGTFFGTGAAGNFRLFYGSVNYYALTQTAGIPSGGTFPVGVTTNTFSVTDAAGNSATCSFNVTVTDNENPVITCPANITVCGSQAVSYTTPTATDNCSAVVTQTAGLPSGSVFPVGTTINTFRATDPAGNFVTCSFNVIVNPIPNAVATPASQTSCSGTAITTIVLSGNVAGTVYNWTRDNNLTVTGIAASGAGNISGTLTNTTNAPITITFTITPSYTNAGLTCTGTSITATVVVNPIPNAVATPASQTTCSGVAITTIALTGNVTGTVYNWTRDNGIVTGIANSGSGDISGTLTNPTNIPVTITFTITPSYTNAGVTCTGTPITATVVVNPTPTVNSVANQVVCNGAPTAAVTFTGVVTAPPGTVYTWSNNTPSIGLAAGPLTGNIASFTAINTGTAPVMATLTVTPSYTNGGTTCTGTPITFTITVNPTATVNPIANRVRCYGTTIGSINFSSPTTGGTIVYNWTNTAPTIGIPASGSGNIPNTRAINTSNIPVVATITVTPAYTNGGTTCNGTPMSFTITVNPTPNFNTALFIPGTLTLADPVYNRPEPYLQGGACVLAVNPGEGTAVHYKTHTFTLAAPSNVTISLLNSDGGNVTPIGRGQDLDPSLQLVGPGGFVPGAACTNSIAHNDDAGFLPNVRLPRIVTTTPLAAGTYTVVVTTWDNTPGTLAVNDVPLPWNYTLAVHTTSQTVCNGALTAPLNFTTTVPGTVFDWTNNDPSIGLAASGSGSIASFVATNATTAPVTATITVTPSYTNAGLTCSGAPVLYYITVNPTPTAIATPASQTICSATAITPIVITGNAVAGVVYNWTRDNTGTVTGIAASGAGNISGTLTNTTNVPVTVTFTITPTANGCPGAAVTATVTVNPTPDVNQPANQVVCNGAPTAPVTFTGAVAGTVFNWTNNTPSIGLAASGTGNIASFNAINSGTTPVVATVIVTPSTGVSGSATFNFTGALQTWTVPAGVTLVTINGKGAQGGTGTNIPNPGGLGADITGTVTVTPGESLSILVGGQGQAWIGAGAGGGGTFIWKNTGNVPQIIAGGGGGGGFRGGSGGAGSATVTPTIANRNQPGGSGGNGGTGGVFAGDNSFIGQAGGGTGWLSSGLSGTGPAPNATGGIYPLAGVTPGAGGFGFNNFTNSNIFGGYGGGGGTAGNGGSGGGGGGYNGGGGGDSWNGSTWGSGGGGGSFNAGSSQNNLAGVNAGNGLVTISYTGTVCTGTPRIFTYTVNPTPNATATPASQTTCSGAAITPIALTGTVAGTVYNWTRDNPIVTGIAASGTGTPISGTLTNPTNLPITVTFTITPTYTNAGVTCTGTPITATVLVNPTPTVNAVANQVVCNGAPTTAVVFTGAVTNPPGTVYNWTNNTTSIGLAASGTGNIASFTAINTGTAPVTATITVTPSYTNGGTTCTGTPTTFTITVNPTPTVIVPANAFVCNGTVQNTGTYNFSTTATGGVTTYSWTNNDISIGLGASGSGNSLPTFTATNPTNVPITGTITVTPTFTNGGVSCVGTPNSFSITVNPTPNATATPASQTICSATAITTIVNTGTVVGTVFNWTRDNNATATGIAASGVGNISGTLTNTTNGPVLVTFTITPTYTNGGTTCTGPTTTATVLVNPLAVVNPVPNQIVCNGDMTAPVIFGSPTFTGTLCGTANEGSSITLTAPPGTVITGVNFASYGTPNGGCGSFTIGGCHAANSMSVVSGLAIGQNSVTIPATNATFGDPCFGTSKRLYVEVRYAAMTYNWTNNLTSIGLAAAGTGNIAAFTATNPGTAPVTATITVTPTYTNGGISCVGTPSTFTITVNPTGQVNQPASQVICNGAPTYAVNFTTTTPGTVFNWVNNTTSIGLAASGTGNIASFTAINITNAPVVATIVVTPVYVGVGPSCPGPTKTFTITVNPTPTVNPVANQVVCNGSPTTAVNFTGFVPGTVFNWTNNTTSIGLAASGTGNIASFTAINITNAPVVATIVVTPVYVGVGPSCPGPTKTFTITVNPTPTVNPVANQVVCNGSPTTAVNFTGFVAGTVYNWTNSLPSIGLAAAGTGNIASFTAINLGTVPVTATISVTPTYTNGGIICNGTSTSFTITVNPSGQVNQPANQVVCNGSPTAPVNFTTTTPGTVFNWTNSNTTIGLAASGTGNIASFIGTNVTNAPVVATITVTPTTPAVPGGYAYSPIAFAPLATSGTAVSLSDDQVSGALPLGFNFNFYGNNYSQFYISSNGFITFDPGANNGCCSGQSIPDANNPNDLIAAVWEDLYPPGGGTITYYTTGVAPNRRTVVSYNNLPFFPNSIPEVNTQIILYEATNIIEIHTANVVPSANIITQGVENSTGTVATATPGRNASNWSITNDAVRFTPSVAAPACPGTPKTFTITVNPTPTVNPVANQVVCNGSPTTAVNFTGFVPGTVYNWTNNTTSIGLAAAGTGNIASFTAINLGTVPVTATITVTPAYTNGGVTCTGTATSFTITVNPTPQVNQPANQVVCAGSPTAPVNFTGPVAGTIYNWTNNNTSIGLAASGTGDIASFTAINATNLPVVATIVVTPTTSGLQSFNFDGSLQGWTSALGGLNCQSNNWVVNTWGLQANAFAGSNSIGVTTVGGEHSYIMSPILTFAAGSKTITFKSFSNNEPGYSCSWDVEFIEISTDGGSTWTTLNGGSVANLNNVSNDAQWRTITITGTTPATTNGRIRFRYDTGDGCCGGSGTNNGWYIDDVVISSAAASVTCTGPSRTFTITVNPIPVVTPVSNKVYCTGVTTALITFNGTPGSTYSWTNSNTGIGLAASGTGDILPFVTTNTTIGPIVATITVTPSAAGCTGTPITFTITVNPMPIVNPVASQVLCNGSPTAVINFTSPTTGGPTGSLSFQWTNSQPSIGLAATGTGNIQSFTAVNTGLSPVIAILTVTPVYTNAGITCTGTSQTFTITVNPTPTVNPVANQVLCVGSNTAAVNFTGSVFGTIYNWTNNNTSIGLAASGAGNIASFTAINAGTTPQVATITVTPNFSNGVTCPGTPITFTITVNPIPTVNPVANQVVCAGATVTQAFTGPVAGTVYNWTNSNTAIGLGASGTGNLNFVSTNATGAPLTGTITVTPSYTNAGGTCTGTPTTFTITVNPIPTVNAVLPQVLCNGSATAAVNFTGAVAGTVYSWTNTNTTIGLAASGTGNIASFTATNITNTPQTATITVTPTYTNGGTTCTGTAITFTITVNPTPSVNTIANQTVCNGTATTAVTITGPVAGTVYSWTNNNTSIGLGASGTNTIPSFTAINTGSTPVTATITITPVFTNGGISCSGPTSSFTITVNPTAVVNQPADQVLCNGAATAAVVFSGLPPGSTYSWTNNNTAIGLAASGTGNIPSFTATNNTTAPITATITVTPSSTGCGGTAVSFTITVNPTPSVNAIANQTLCAGASTAAVTISGAVAGTVYTWTNNNTTIGLGASGIGNIPSFMTVNPTINPVTATITVTPTFTNGGISCTGPTQSFTITVNPLPNIVFINLPQRVCLTDTIVILRSTPAGGTWSGAGVSGNTFSAAAAGVGVHRVTYTVTNGFGCTTTRFANIVVNDCIERHNVFQQAIRIWPNPNQGRFSVQFNSDVYKEFKVKIVNARGQEMAYYEFKNLVYGQILPFDLSRLAGGTYFLYVYNTKESGVFPIIIQR